MTKFGVYFTCYTEKESVENAIKLLFEIYPDIPVYLVSDGGADYGYLEEKFKGKRIKTMLGEDTRGLIPKIPKENFRSEEWQAYAQKSIVTFFNRVKDAINYCGTEYLLVMEPDVLVRGKLTIPGGSLFSGSRVNKGISKELREIVRKVPGAIDVNHWGATPAIFKSDTFLQAWHKLESDSALLRALCMAEHRLPNYDLTFAVLFALIGVPEERNPDIIECLRDKNWRTKPQPLVHQYRELYPKMDYSGTHATDAHKVKRPWYMFWKH